MDWKGRRQSTNVIDLRALADRRAELEYKMANGQISSEEFQELQKIQKVMSSIAMPQPNMVPPENEQIAKERWEDFVQGRTGSVLEKPLDQPANVPPPSTQSPVPQPGQAIPVPEPAPRMKVPMPEPRPGFASGGLVGLLPDDMLKSPLVNGIAASQEMATRNLLRATETEPKRMSIADEIRLGLRGI